MSRFASFAQWMSRMDDAAVAAMLWLVNVVAGGTTLYAFPSAMTVLLVLSVSSLAALAEWGTYRLLRKLRLHAVFLVVVIALHVLVMIADCFLISRFGFIFDNHAMYILAATDRNEIRSFLSTYLSPAGATCIVIGLAAMLWLLWSAARAIARWRWFGTACAALLAAGLLSTGAIVASYALLHNGMGLHLREMHPFSRVGHACAAMNDRLNEFEMLRRVNSRVTATPAPENAPSVVVIVGESFSVYHSSLYGYSKATNPRLAARAADGSLVAFDDAVSQADFTDAAMCSIFTLTRPGDNWWAAPLFPVVFRAAGYRTQLIDNQYEVGGGLNSFFYDARLSAMMFDSRNERRYNPDSAALSAVVATDGPQLVVVHLAGQHFTYAEHYTPEFARFKPDDYPSSLPAAQQEIVAHYDNATLYNDFVVDQIISKFEHKNCIVVYVSDHGEEVFEMDDFMGHGNAAQRPDPSYQLRVPFMVWMSSAFAATHAHEAGRIRAAAHTPLISDDLPHFLLDVAGIENDSYCPHLSFINDLYDPAKPRLVRGGADYNAIKVAPHPLPRY